MATLSELQEWLASAYDTISLNLAGLLILADFNLAAKRTAQKGTASLLDSFVLVPGLHKQATAPELSKGEFPACAAMTTGYVFRVENPATVYYLQNVGTTGHLTTLSVTPARSSAGENWLAGAAYPTCISLTVGLSLELFFFRDPMALAAIATLIAVRLINAIIIKRQAVPGWFGAPEPGVQSDLLVLLSQDRWVRIKGATDDVKAVTSGTWLRESTAIEGVFEAIAQVLVYISIVLLSNATKTGQTTFLFLILSSTALLALANHSTKSFTMHNRRLQISSDPKKYDRRLTLAKELIQEFGRTDCFVGMGMIQPHQAEEAKKSYKGAVMM